MLRKYQEVKWTIEAKNSFEKIKMALTEARVLVSPDFTKEFLTFSFASEDTLAAILIRMVLNNPSHFSTKLLEIQS